MSHCEGGGDATQSCHVAEMSHYEVLNVAQDASLDEIRRAYQALALRFHPDKRLSHPAPEEPNSNDSFIRIDEAWKVLRDDQARRVYDAELMQSTCREEYFVNETLTRAEFRHEEEEDYHYHTCRCGGLYVLPDGLGPDESCYIGCDECSLVVQVNA
uniref:DnaJ homolog subfamily C member 24 n=1 Tax=Culex pipiens TaxID=7175 RepID=A0A8D8CIS2_CULPI